MHISYDEIARIAGVSKATVSRVIHNVPEGVSDATRKRVKEIISQYEPNDSHQLTPPHNGRSHSIGLILPDIANPFFSELAREISTEAIKYNYTVVLGNTGFSTRAEANIISTFVVKKVDGILLISAGDRSEPEHDLLNQYHIPCLLLDRDVDGLEREMLITIDNQQITYNCCETLINNGSFDIAFITGSDSTTTSKERLNGYKLALTRFGIPYREDLILHGNYTMQGGYDAVLSLERAGVKYSAIMAANDLMALGAMKALKELGYSIPADIEVIGFDNIIYSMYTEPPLTTVQQPTIEMGRVAVSSIIGLIEGNKVSQRKVKLKAKLLRRKTTR